MKVKITGTYVDSPIMTLHTRVDMQMWTIIRVGSNLDIELTQSEALALAADLIRAVNR